MRGYLEDEPELLFQACAVDPGVSGQAVTLEQVRAACSELFGAP